MTIFGRLYALCGHIGATIGRTTVGAALGLTLAMTPQAISQTPMAEDCDVSLQQSWLDELVASAYVSGACDRASIDLVVHNGVDEVVWSASYSSADLFGFDDILDAEAMRVAVGDWLGSYTDSSTSGTLPQWPEGEDMPDAGEFPFYVDETLSRDDYEDIRGADYPMICYIQGRESSLCLIRVPGVNALIGVGAQSFPG